MNPIDEQTQADYDFDNFDEDKIIDALRDELSVKYIILEKGKAFVAKFHDGKVVEVPLLFSVQEVEKLSSLEEQGAVAQLRELLDAMCEDEKTAQLVLEHSFAEVQDFATKYFRVVEKISGASLPE